MSTRGTMMLLAAAGTAAHAQEVIRVTHSWSEVVAGTLTPVSSPNSVIEPGEGARIAIKLEALVNGANAIGQTVSYTPPPAPGFGTIRGIASFVYNLQGTGGDATGAWSNRAISPILSAGAFTGTILNGGAHIDTLGGGQFVAPGQTANSTNPIADAWIGVWSPTSYLQRTVNFRAEPYLHPPGQYNGVLVHYGSAFVDPSDPTTEYALYLTKYILGSFDPGANIPIVPAPTSGPLLVLAGAAALRHRRRA
jgi:hypothetical protein